MLSERELMVLDILYDKEHVSHAKKELLEIGLSLDSTYKIIQRLRNKSSKWMTGWNQVLGWRRKSKPQHKLLDRLLYFKS